MAIDFPVSFAAVSDARLFVGRNGERSKIVARVRVEVRKRRRGSVYVRGSILVRELPDGSGIAEVRFISPRGALCVDDAVRPAFDAWRRRVVEQWLEWHQAQLLGRACAIQTS